MASANWFRPALIAAAALIAAGLLAGVLVNGCGSGSGATETVTTSAAGATTAASDPAVADLQRLMTRLGFYSGPIDGAYGDETTAAVTEMQKALGVPADGVYGPATDAALKGKGNEVVTQIQTELAKYGYYTGPIDGDYGAGTKAAVQKLQTDLGLTSDGLISTETVDAFHKAVADGKLKPATTTTTTTAPAATTTAPTTTAESTTTTPASTTTTAPTTTAESTTTTAPATTTSTQ